MKVYCKNCKYFEDACTYEYQQWCTSEENKKVGNYYSEDIIIYGIPKEINKDNDCKYFENKA